MIGKYLVTLKAELDLQQEVSALAVEDALLGSNYALVTGPSNLPTSTLKIVGVEGLPFAKIMPNHEGWNGLHGPVTYMGQTLYTDDPRVLLCYWEGFCKMGEGHFERLNEEYPELSAHNANAAKKRDCPLHEFQPGCLVFVFIERQLRCWWNIEDAPTFEELRWHKGKAVALDYLKNVTPS